MQLKRRVHFKKKLVWCSINLNQAISIINAIDCGGVKESGLKVLSLEVRSDNDRVHLYESLGFQKLGTFKHFMEINDLVIDFDIAELSLEQK